MQNTKCLEMYWLGHPYVTLGGEPVKFEMRKALAMLVYLSQENRPIPREVLATLFWPEYSQQKAFANLRRNLASLDQSLNREWLLPTRETISLTNWPKIRLDTRTFHQSVLTPSKDIEGKKLYEATAALYRGPFLEGFNLPDCPEFDDWQQLQREEYQRDLAIILQKLTKELSCVSDWDSAIRFARRWVALDKFHEPAQQALMQLYVQSEQRSAAIQHYEEYQRLLRDELGQEPGCDLIRLYEDLRSEKGGKAVVSSSVDSELREKNAGEAASRTLHQAEQILKTKLFIPSIRQKIVERTQLIDRLNLGLDKRLMLVSAPAGYGKSTLLSSWVRRCSHQIAWLSLDENDNDLFRYVKYITIAIQNAVSEAINLQETRLPASLFSFNQTIASSILTSLLNQLCELKEPFFLVLDDYQFISNNEIHELTGFLIDKMPDIMHVIIATRTDPPIPIARLRSRGQIIELRASDLQFNDLEAEDFLNNIMGLNLDPESVLVLEERTEGWIAGLKMASLALQGSLSMHHRKGVFGFIEELSGTNRYILDYLIEEVLANQSLEIQKFLLCTSILERLSAQLCDAVLAMDERSRNENDERLFGSRSLSTSQSAAIMESLERANLFLIPLDDERIWYRYHHLFRDLLIHRFKNAYSLKEIKEYHRRAACWLEANNFIGETIQHLLDADDYEKAADFVEKYTLQLFNQGKLHQLLSWTGILPEAIIVQRPGLSIYKAWILVFAGKPMEAQRMVDIARQAILSSTLSAKEVRGLEIELAGIQGLIAIHMGDPIPTLSLEELVKVEEASDHLFAWSVIHWSIGFAHSMRGDSIKAIPEFQQAVKIGEQLRDAWTVLSGSDGLGAALRLTGRLREAEAVYRRGLQLIDLLGSSESGFVGRLESALSIVLYDHNELDDAHQLALNSITHNRMWENPNHTVNGFWALARVLIAQGELEEANQVLQKAENILDQTPIIPSIRADVENLRVHWWLVKGMNKKADEWLADHPISLDAIRKPVEGTETQAISAARILIADRNKAAACELLDVLETSAREMNRIHSLIQILVLNSMAEPEPAAVLKNLEEALRYSQIEGYQRVFLDEGQAMQLLLMQWLDQASDGTLCNYATQLLAQF